MPTPSRRLPLTICVLAIAACSDALEQDTNAGQVVAIVNSASASLSLISAERLSLAGDVSLPVAPNAAGSVAGLGSVLAVSLGDTNAVAIIDLALGASVTRVIPIGRQASGVALVDDSIGWVVNVLDSRVTRFNYRTGDTSSVAVPANPQSVLPVARQVWVVVGDFFSVDPLPSRIAVIDASSRTVVGSIPLTGRRAAFAVLGMDGLVYVVHQAVSRQEEGKISIVDPATRREVAVLNGLGVSPGRPVYHPSGRLLVPAPLEGILEVNVATRTVTRGPGAGVKPAGDDLITALALDQRGRVYAVDYQGCIGSPGVVHVLSGPPDYRVLRSLAVGLCPANAAVARVP